MFRTLTFLCLLLTCSPGCAQSKQDNIVHDAEYYILEAQNGKKWTAEVIIRLRLWGVGGGPKTDR